MNKTQDETKQTDAPEQTRKVKPRHPYFFSNSREETIRRMRTFPERAEKFLKKLNADREKNPR